MRTRTVNRSTGGELRTEKLDIRLSRSSKQKLQSAALSLHRSVSDFVMESALAKAEEMLADRRIFALDAERWAAFQAALNEPVRALPRLRKLLQEPAFFDPDVSA